MPRQIRFLTTPIPGVLPSDMLLLAVLSALLALYLLVGISTPVSFDGAMNLQVSRSLSLGEGYRRYGAGDTLFPHEIQTHAPLVVPAALVFKMFGVGVASSQAVGLMYLFAFTLLLLLLARGPLGWRWAGLAAILVLLTPGMHQFALNGYGELIALFWWLWGTWTLLRVTPQAAGLSRVLLGGVLLGLALATKTVMLIGLVVSIAVFLVQSLRSGPVNSVKAGLALGIGIALPLTLFELWKLASLGWEGYAAWWGREAGAIFQQAGVREGFEDSESLAQRVLTHAGILASALKLALPLLVLHVTLVLGSVLWLLRARRLAVFGPLLAVLLLTCLAYFAWWLGVTPTEKAWYRRIFNGVILLQVLGVVLAALLVRGGSDASAGYRKALALVLLLCPLWLAATQLQRLVQAGAGTELAELTELRGVLDRLPADARLFGRRWYSAPVPSLYSGRTIENVADVSVVSLAQQAPVYLVLDAPAISADIFDGYLLRHRSTEITALRRYQVHRIEAGSPLPAFGTDDVDEAELAACVDLSTPYPYLYGYYRVESGGRRWMRADSEVVITAAGGDTVGLDFYIPDPRTAYLGAPPSLVVDAWLDECHLGSRTLARGGNHRPRWPVTCEPPDVSHVRLRFAVNKVLDAPDSRQLAVFAQHVGWMSEAREGMDSAAGCLPYEAEHE